MNASPLEIELGSQSSCDAADDDDNSNHIGFVNTIKANNYFTTIQKHQAIIIANEEKEDDEDVLTRRLTRQQEEQGFGKCEDDDTQRQKVYMEEKLTEFYSTVHIHDFICSSDPWLLVSTGSFCNLFDWVPEHKRVGPWNKTAIIYLLFLMIGTIYLSFLIYASAASRSFNNNSNNETVIEWSIFHQGILPTSTTLLAEFDQLEYPRLHNNSAWWYYNMIAFLWMIYILCKTYQTPVGILAWVTYTVQSWTLLTIRHGLCIVAPYCRMALYIAEIIRFPSCITPVITFTAWNFIIFPYAYFILMDTTERKRIFYNLTTCFPMLNLHIVNVVLCVVHVGYVSPPRRLYLIDFYVAWILLALYAVFYFFILDRIGFHLYQDFSPRSNGIVIIMTWSLLIFFYWEWFQFWCLFFGIMTNEQTSVPL